jgi:iron complex transport system substrate-binding protein
MKRSACMNARIPGRKLLRTFVSALAALCLGATGSIAAATTERWIVPNSYVAEIVVALGARDRVVGVGGGTDHIPELEGIPRLRGFRQSSAEPMLSLGPTHLVMVRDWAVPQVLAQMRAAGVEVETLDGEQSPAGVARRVRAVAQLLGKPAEGERLIARFQRELADVAALIAKETKRPRALFILAGGGRPTLVGGRGTNAAALLELAGARNVAQGIEGFKVMSVEAMIEAAPEYVLTNRDGAATTDGIPVALRAPGALHTPAGRSMRLITVPGHYLQGMGILTPQGAMSLARQLHGR